MHWPQPARRLRTGILVFTVSHRNECTTFAIVAPVGSALDEWLPSTTLDPKFDSKVLCTYYLVSYCFLVSSSGIFCFVSFGLRMKYTRHTRHIRHSAMHGRESVPWTYVQKPNGPLCVELTHFASKHHRLHQVCIRCAIGSVVACVIAIHATRVRFSDIAYAYYFEAPGVVKLSNPVSTANFFFGKLLDISVGYGSCSRARVKIWSLWNSFLFWCLKNVRHVIS